MWEKSRKWAKSLEMIKEAYQRDLHGIYAG